MRSIYTIVSFLLVCSCAGGKVDYELINKGNAYHLNGKIVDNLRLELEGLNCTSETKFHLVNNPLAPYETVINAIDLIASSGCGENIILSTSNGH